MTKLVLSWAAVRPLKPAAPENDTTSPTAISAVEGTVTVTTLVKLAPSDTDVVAAAVPAVTPCTLTVCRLLKLALEVVLRLPGSPGRSPLRSSGQACRKKPAAFLKLPLASCVNEPARV